MEWTKGRWQRSCSSQVVIALVCGFLLLLGQAPEPLPERSQTERPRRGPLAPIRYGLSSVGKAANRALLRIEKSRSGKPIQPVFGGLGDGAGITGGARFSAPLWDVDLMVTGRISTRNYQSASVAVSKAFGRVRTGPEVAYRSSPQEDYFGRGAGSLESDRTTFSVQERAAAWTTRARFSKLELRHSFRVRSFGIGEGTDDWFPATQEVFSPSEVEGGFTGSHYVTNNFGALLDFRNDRLDPRSGTALDATVALNHGFRRTESEFTTLRLVHYAYMPLSERMRHVIALRTEAVRNISGEPIPFYAHPTLGGSGTLRGFREFRLRDRDALAISAEYRYAIWDYLDAALFLDAGQVYSNIFEDIGRNGLHSSHGIGLRLHSRRFSLQAHLGRSSEGARAFLKFGPPSW